MKTVTIQLDNYAPDAWNEAIIALGIESDVYEKFLDQGEYATVELTLDASLSVLNARLVPR